MPHLFYILPSQVLRYLVRVVDHDMLANQATLQSRLDLTLFHPPGAALKEDFYPDEVAEIPEYRWGHSAAHVRMLTDFSPLRTRQGIFLLSEEQARQDPPLLQQQVRVRSRFLAPSLITSARPAASVRRSHMRPTDMLDPAFRGGELCL